MSRQIHTSDRRILDRRTLENDHRRLAAQLRPGLRVLDVGCGTGSITAGIAQAVGPSGYVVGMDRDPALLKLARDCHASVPNLRFEERDVLTLDIERRFDVVTAARTLQWIEKPELALSRMKAAAKPQGFIIVLEYNHARNSWEPEPPLAFRRFYAAFLEWRAANGWDNEIADRLSGMFAEAGLRQIEVHVEDEVARLGEPGFSDKTNIWGYVIETIGATITAAGHLTESERLAAGAAWEAWRHVEMKRQTFEARAVEGRAP